MARDAGCVQPDWEAVLAELGRKRQRRRTRVTRRQLWVEYRDEARAQGATAYSYSRFCALLAERLDGEGREAQMRFDYEPGLWGLSDFSGKTLALRTGRGETDVELFVAVLAHSRMIYAEAVPDQSVRHWTMVHRRALEYFGGVPSRWVIDNLKAGVHKADREEPQLNASFREFAQHYNVAVLPARSGRATDKGLVESAVGAVQTRILLALRHETFFSLDAMNAAIRRELDRLNAAPMASGSTRRAVFEATERPALQALPAHPWEWGEWVERKVGPNGHVRVEHNHYSVPEGHLGRNVAARLGERMVEVRSRHARVLSGMGGDAEHHVDILGRPEVETRRVEQQIASGAADDRVLALVPREMFAELPDSGYHATSFSNRSAAIDTRSSRWFRKCA